MRASGQVHPDREEWDKIRHIADLNVWRENDECVSCEFRRYYVTR